MSTLRQSVLEGPTVRVQFCRQRDRFQHAIWRRAGSRWIEVLGSVEGTPDDPWPPSPPLQSLHFDDRAAGRQLALLVGMAGRCHWSLSVELDPALDLLRFDVACRVRGEPGPLGSRYRAKVPIEIAKDASGIICGAPEGLRLELDHRFGGTRLASAGDGVTIEPHLAGPVDGAQTIRWAYSLGPLRAEAVS